MEASSDLNHKGSDFEAAQNNNTEAQQNTSSVNNISRLTAIGHAIWLMHLSPAHKHLFITDIEWLVTPPISLDQFRLWQKEETPIGFASWAYLSEDVEERIQSKGIRKLMPTDWKSGDQLWLIDFLAPFGGQEEMLKDLKEKALNGQTIKSFQPGPDGKAKVVDL